MHCSAQHNCQNNQPSCKNWHSWWWWCVGWGKNVNVWQRLGTVCAVLPQLPPLCSFCEAERAASLAQPPSAYLFT